MVSTVWESIVIPTGDRAVFLLDGVAVIYHQMVDRLAAEQETLIYVLCQVST